ncbi:MAG TPA: hypothetical protein V6D46_04025, partial [Coleofasciculaceae cyanobacterium]
AGRSGAIAREMTDKITTRSIDLGPRIATQIQRPIVQAPLQEQARTEIQLKAICERNKSQYTEP